MNWVNTVDTYKEFSNQENAKQLEVQSFSSMRTMGMSKGAPSIVDLKTKYEVKGKGSKTKVKGHEPQAILNPVIS